MSFAYFQDPFQDKLMPNLGLDLVSWGPHGAKHR